MKYALRKIIFVAFAIISCCHATATPNAYYQTLIGERVTLRPIQETDADALTPIYSSAASMKYFLYNKGLSVKQIAERTKILAIHTQSSHPSRFDWVITLKGIVIGQVGVTFASFDGEQNSIHYILNPNYYGSGYATEAARLVLDFIKTPFQATVHPDNEASKKVLAKLNFVLTERKGIERYGKLKEIYSFTPSPDLPKTP